MMCGLQGAGKTTMCGKLAVQLKKQGKKPFKIFTKLPKNEEVEAVEDDDIDSTNYIDEDDPDNYKRTTGIIQDLGRKFVNIFKQSTSSDNDDDDL